VTLAARVVALLGAVIGSTIFVMAQLVQNLLTNAARHAKGLVRVSLVADAATATLLVTGTQAAAGWGCRS
jgi:signal transduction histidine kinase